MINTQALVILQTAIIYSSTVATNLTVLPNSTDKINRISNHFWDRFYVITWIYVRHNEHEN